MGKSLTITVEEFATRIQEECWQAESEEPYIVALGATIEEAVEDWLAEFRDGQELEIKRPTVGQKERS